MNNIKTTIIFISLLVYSIPCFAAGQRDIFGAWGSVKLQGDFTYLSPELSKFKWTVMNQTRTRDDSSKGSRFFQDLLFGQVDTEITTLITNDHTIVTGKHYTSESDIVTYLLSRIIYFKKQFEEQIRADEICLD